MTWVDFEASSYLRNDQKTGYETICFIQDTPLEILKRIRKFNVAYKEFYGQDFVRFIDGHYCDYHADDSNLQNH